MSGASEGVFCVGVVQSRIEHLFAKAKGKDEKEALPFFTHYGEVTDLNNLVSNRHIRDGSVRMRS